MSRKLSEYERKRNRKQTPEPFGGKRGKAKAPIFVVQRHDARRLHYDFRLERDGALASWAVPKGVPLEPGEQHLAVHVEDHPLEYATFAGEIPKGNYGAGTVEVWDHGTYELLEEKKDGGLTVRLHGERLEGTWALVPAHLSGDEKNWLILRKRDEGATPGKRRAYRAMLATLTEELPHGEGWEYEPKWDGYRVLGYVRGGEVKLLSRNGNDLTQRFELVAKELVKALRTPDAVVDGEVAALDAHGKASFSAMQQGSTHLAYEVFDLLEADGEPRRRAAADRAPGQAREAARAEPGRPALRLLQGRGCAAGGGPRAGARGRDGQARGVALPGGEAQPRLAEDQDARPAGVRDLRLHEGPGPAQRPLRRPRPGRPPRPGLGVGRQRGDGFRGTRHRRVAGEARAATARRLAVSRRAEDAEGEERRRRLGRAEARLQRWSSPSGRTTGTYARRPSRGSATTSRRWMYGGSGRPLRKRER